MLVHHRKKYLVISILANLVLLLAACKPEVTVAPTQTIVATTSTEVVVTEAPTPTTEVPSVILVISPDSDLVAAIQTKSILEILTAESSLTLNVLDSLTADQLTEYVRIVVGVGDGIDLAGLAASAPAIQFVAIDQLDAIPSSNLSVIGDPVLDQERKSFMAGYLTALVSSDYKVGGIVPSDSPLTTETVNAYVIGTRFFCGLCNPKYPPYNAFPQWETIPVDSGQDAFQSVVDGMANLGVEVVYVHADLVSPDRLSYLSEIGMEVVGGASPDMERANWVGTIALDPSLVLERFWPGLITGAGGQQAPNDVVLVDLEAGLVSEGRERYFDEMAAELADNLVLPETVP
jgi:hypothetical protein